MHSRNPYQQPPDFQALAEEYPPLKKHLIPSPYSPYKTIDFTNENSLRRLSEAILRRDFQLEVQLPLDRLCPPIPNRLNYVLWMQDIMNAHHAVLPNLESRAFRGIDIGTGPAAIYALLGCRLIPNLSMVATEIDEFSFSNAQAVISSNNLQGRLQVLRASLTGPILSPLVDGMYDFTMCNPPFYSSAEEVANLAASKKLPPSSICTGADVEMIYPGGEVAFVGQMIQESERFRTRCRWYTSMLGKLSSVSTVIDMLRGRSIYNYGITEFVQGQTRRWAIAWSYTDEHLPDSVARIQFANATLHPLMPARNTLFQSFDFSSSTKRSRLPSLQSIQKILIDVLESIENAEVTLTTQDPNYAPLSESLIYSPPPVFIKTRQNTWSRNARRQRRAQSTIKGSLASAQASKVGPTLTSKASAPNSGPLSVTSTSASEMTCSIHWVNIVSANSVEPGQGKPTGCPSLICSSATLEFQWVYGQVRGTFDTFFNHVGRKVKISLGFGNTK